MAEAIVSAVLEQLSSITIEEARQQISLVGDVRKEVKKLTANLEAIKGVLLDAEQKKVKEPSVKNWLDQLKDASYDIEDVLDEWKTKMMKLRGGQRTALISKKACFFFPSPCFYIKQIVLCRRIALKIKEINENLDDIAERKDRYKFSMNRSIEKQQRGNSISLVDVSGIFGRDDEENILLSKLLCENNKAQEGLHIIAIVGLGGVGKTTLAKLAYNNEDVINNFEKRIWVCVSDPFDEFMIAKAIIFALDPNDDALKSSELQDYMESICKLVMEKKILLVLDDVWTENNDEFKPFYHCLKNSFHGSRILITTRNERVALAHMVKSSGIITIKKLSTEASWSIFKQIAFFGSSIEECEELKEVGEKIVEMCNGLPLAIKTIGSLFVLRKIEKIGELS